MFKKAKVLYYIENSQTSIEEIYDFLDNIKVEGNYKIIPDLLSYNKDNDSAFVNLNNFLLPGTIIAQNYQFNDNFVFFCLPANSLHFSMPVKPGELIWYFEDNEINEIQKSILDNYPLLSIKYYWTSRIIGSRISEDLNYSSKENDFLITKVNYKKENVLYDTENVKVLDKKNNKSFVKEITNKVILPDYSIPDVLTQIKNEETLISSNQLYSYYKDDKDFTPSAVPRYFSKSHELSIQGSHNSLINLTIEEEYKKSQVDFVVGRHYAKSFRPKVLNNDYFVLGNIDIQNQNSDLNEIDVVQIDKQKGFNVFVNSFGDEILFKNPDYYLGEDYIDDSPFESEINYIYDASRIILNEESDVNIYYRSYSDILCKIINSFDAVIESNDILDINDIKSIDNFNLSINNNNENKSSYFERIEVFDEIKPNILIKSNDIRIVSRMKLKNIVNEISLSPFELESGNILLCKEGNKYLDDSLINLEKNGDIFIDGKTIYLGSFNKEILRQNIKNESDIFDEIDKESFDEINSINYLKSNDEVNNVFDISKEEADRMIGNGMGVVLGYNQKYSEPLVLGNSLIVILKNLIDTNIVLIDEVKKLSDDLSKHIHLGVTPGAGISGPVQNPGPYINYSSTSSNELNNSLEEIKQNLKFILSKFAKTS